MNFLPYLFKKDFFRIKMLLLVWFLLIIAQSALSIGGISIAAEFLRFQVFLPLLTKLLGVLQGLIIIVIVPLIIQDDSLVGTTAFWFTRPISRKALLITKSCLIFTFLTALPLIAEIVVLTANGAAFHHILLAAPEILLEKLAFIIPFFILAVLTPKFSKYALVGIIVFAVIAVIGIIASVAAMFLPAIPKNLFYNVEFFKNPSLAASCDVAEDVYMIFIGSILVIHQFLTRNTSRTIKFFVVSWLILFCFPKVWNWDFLKEVTPAKNTAAMSTALSIDFNTKDIIVSDALRYSRKGDRKKSITVKQTIKGLPPEQFAILRKNKNTQIKYPDGTILKSEYLSTNRKVRVSDEKFMSPLQAVLGEIKLLNPFLETTTHTEIFSIKQSDFYQYKGKVGAYSTQADFDIYKYEISSQVFLKQGARALFGSEQIVIYDVLEKPNGISVIIGEKKINLLFDRTVIKKSPYDFAKDIYSNYKQVYVIVNKKRNEAFLAEVGGSLFPDVAAAYGKTRLETKAKQFDFTYVNDRNGTLPKIDKKWMADAEMLKIAAVKIGTQHSDFEIENFTLPSKSTKTINKIDEIERQLRLQDKQMKKLNPE